MEDKIVIRGAKEHNLKNVSLELPRNKFIVLTQFMQKDKEDMLKVYHHMQDSF